jgi:hypothetical protein
MATAKKPTKPHGNSRAAKMRKYYIAHPNAKPAEVAKEFNTSYQIAYMVKRKMQPKKILVTATEIEIANKLGITAEDYAKGKADLIQAEKKERARLAKQRKQEKAQKFIDQFTPGTSIGGLTLTRRVQDGQYVYTWVRDELIASGEVLVDAHTENVDNVNHPAHYKVGGIETIDFIEAKKLGYNLGNVVKYITRSDHKDNKLQDLEKAAWYLNRAISQIKESA